MARQHKALSGGVIVLCTIFLFASAVHSQNIVIRKKTFVLSGAVGLPGVTMQGLPGALMTDENGVYSAEVEYGWSGTVTPVKLGYVFEPKQKVYQRVKASMTEESYAATLLTFTISGSTGQPGVTLKGLPNDPVSDQAGRYTVKLEYGWTGTVIPEKVGYRFDPSSKMYTQVIKNYTNDNYKAHELTFTLSGSVGADGVVMKGLPGNVVTAGGGNYRAELPYGWTGTITPMKEGHEFLPPSREYPAVMSPQTNQDYTTRVFTFQISGTTNMAGVTLKGLPDDPMTDTNGFYTATVPYGWSGKVIPERAGYTFAPTSKSYSKVVTNYESQDYNPTIIQVTISGNAGGGGITLEGLPGKVVSDASGFYTAKVEFGWVGTVTAMKDGWYFEPSNKIYSSVTIDQANQNFRGQRITFKITGNVGLPGVVLEGLPARPTSGADGSYSAVVDYKWTGKVTPRKSGFTFEPAVREYSELLSPQPAQDFTARILQHVISGRIVGESGPVADVFVLADNNAGSATTDTNGAFQLTVDHGWRGKLTPQKDGFTFTPASKSFEPVAQTVSNAGFTARVKMLSITDAVLFGIEPIQGVTVTADPGGYKAVTDAKGKYTLRVPYGWSGGLQFEKEEFDIEASITYDNVTDDIDNTAPAAPVYTPPAAVTPPSTLPTQPVAPPTTPVDPQRDQLIIRLEQIQRELEAIKNPNAATLRPDQRLTAQPPTPAVPDLPPVNAYASNLVDVLTQIMQKTGVKIAVDKTVKSVPVAVDFDWTGVPVPLALQRILGPTGYTFKAMGDAYLVYRPITNTFIGDDLRQALQDVAMEAGVTIVSDPNVAGEVYAELQDVPLETALRTMLAGSPFVVKVTPDYYLVADRSVDSDAFPEISETRNVWLNYTTPQRVLQLLSPAFAPYAKADDDPNGHVISVTASPALASRIIEDIKRLDPRPKHVLLDARIVVMERTDLLDVGVEWGWPTIAAGAFGTSFDTGGGGSWPWGVQIGYTSDQTFTNSLLMALNLLQENKQAEIVSNPQILAQDGKMSEIRVMTEEYYMLSAETDNIFAYTTTEMVTIESGTKLAITPRIGDNNDITLEIAAEVSDSIPSAAETRLPVVTRRTARNVVTVQNGGTVALAGLTENRSKKVDTKVPGLSGLPLIGGLFKNTNDTGKTREIAVFVTAHLVPETSQPLPPQPRSGQLFPSQPAPQGGMAMQQPAAGATYRQRLEQSLASQPR